MGADDEKVPPEVRAAISNFLNDIQNDPQPFAVSDALRAVRRVFPDLDVSDADLADAVASEASTAGLHIHYDIDQVRKTSSLERWENEGGTVGQSEQGNEAAPRKTDDTDGAGRGAKAKRKR